jgi:ABC-2 type transport system permease protein
MAAAMLPASPGPSQVVLRSPALVEIVYPRNSTIAAGVTAALTAAVDGRVAAGELAAAAAGTSAASAGDIATQAAETPPPLKAVDDSAGKRPNTIGYFGPGMAIIFLFIGAGAGARSLLGERDTGTLARLAIAPVRPASVIAGKVGAVVLTALASILAVWGVTTLVFSATWGQPAAVLAMCVATVLAFAGLALFIAVAAKTPGQAETATLVLGFGLALFGGNFFPPGTLPPLFEKLTLLTPNGWALQGFGSLAIDGAHFPTVVTPLIVLVVIAAAFGVVSLARLPKAFAA